MRRASHESLIETHRLLMEAFTQATKTPHGAGHKPPILSSSSSSSSITTPLAKLGSLSPRDYPAIKFWTKLDWKKLENTRKDVPDLEARSGGHGGTRSSKGENVMMLYIEDAAGSPVDGTVAGAIRDFARSIWRNLYSQGIAPDRWGDASKEIRDKYYHEMESAFMPLRYCNNHWKAQMIVTSIYSQWHHTFGKKHQFKEEPSPHE